MGDTSYMMLPGDFLTTYWVRTYHQLNGEVYEAWNDPTLFDIYYKLFDKRKTKTTRVNAILCTDYINGDYWRASYNEGQIANALKELKEPDVQLCPDINQFVLSGGTRSHVGRGVHFVVQALKGASVD